MVADHQRHHGRELRGLLPPQQVEQAVAELRDQDRHARHLVAEAQVPSHPEPLRDRAEPVGDLFPGQAEPVQLPLHALQEHPLLDVGMLVGPDDVAARR
jgi:hypothetical protein